MKIKPKHKYRTARLPSLPRLLTIAALSAGLAIAAQPVAAQSSDSSGDGMEPGGRP